ncbi:MAG: primosomal protein N', partial [Deltaproteobacteria bacterium]|nr:primosomal protein N' [Deltaproteobacteria bacterium]
ESLKNAGEGKSTHLTLPERVNNMPLPDIEIIDMKKNKKDWISPRLKSLIKENLEKGEQTLLFLNRRGFSPFVLCFDCGQDFKCPNCAVSLTWHQSKNELICHYCDYTHSSLPACPSCNGLNVKGVGMGTEQIEESLAQLFQGAKIARMDRDTIKGKGELDKLLHNFGKGKYDILVGTQMIAKGHHFPGVTLVGVILADLSLNIPDFRAAERTYQLLTQVAGRAGRGEKKGKVLIQTFNPGHYSILHGGEKDSETFYDMETSIRKALSYPPYARLVNFKIWGSDAEKVEKGAIRLKAISEKILKKTGLSQVDILGPAPAPLSKLKGKSRWQMLARSTSPAPIHQFSRILMKRVKEEGKYFGRLKVIADFDPYNMM